MPAGLMTHNQNLTVAAMKIALIVVEGLILDRYRCPQLDSTMRKTLLLSALLIIPLSACSDEFKPSICDIVPLADPDGNIELYNAYKQSEQNVCQAGVDYLSYWADFHTVALDRELSYVILRNEPTSGSENFTRSLCSTFKYTKRIDYTVLRTKHQEVLVCSDAN